jgi:hypothetical protein
MTEFICPQANVCAANVLGASECGTTPLHLPPMPSGELCTRALAGQIPFEANNPDEWKQFRREYRAASAHVDRALSLPPHDPAVELHLDEAAGLIDRVLDNPETTIDVAFEATMVGIYLPAFEAVQANQMPSADEYAEQLGDLGQLADTIEASSTHPSRQRGLMYKLVLPMALARSGVLYLPALARQAHSRHPDASKQHFDGLVFTRGQRVPIKARGSAKREGEYNESVLFLGLIQVVSGANPDVTPKAEVVDRACGLLRAEANNDPIDPADAQWLDRIAKDVLWYAHAFIEDSHTTSNQQ